MASVRQGCSSPRATEIEIVGMGSNVEIRERLGHAETLTPEPYSHLIGSERAARSIGVGHDGAMPAMSKEEREEYLARPHVGMIAIEDEGRGPLVTPIWYSYEPGGVLKVQMNPESKKAKLLAKAGRFSLAVQRERLPYKYVMVEGPVISTEPCDRETETRPMAVRYLGDELASQYLEGLSGESIVVTMQPERWYSTDYGK